MKHILSEPERSTLDQRVAEAEKRTGAEIVLAVVERSDSYVELPWKAFALGAAVAGAGIGLLDLLRPAWTTGTAVLFAVVAMLATGAACALLSVALPRFGRLFLAAPRAEVEARQYAESLFLSRQVFATADRIGVLLFVGIFERQVVLLPDVGLARQLGQEAMEAIVGRMTAELARGQVARALEQGIRGLEEQLAPASRGAGRGNELPNDIIEEKGA
jgi:putative membrane protein